MIAKQDGQAVPIAYLVSAIVGAAMVDKATPQPVVVVTKLELVPASVEMVGQDSGSKDSVVQASQVAESRTGAVLGA